MDLTSLTDHELATLTRLREGTYGGESGTPEVYFEDGGVYRDLADLYELLPRDRDDGTPHLENAQIENMTRTLQERRPLSLMEIGLLKRLKAKYADQLQALREDPNRLDGRDYVNSPDPATARLGG